jgi:hypothetical protein
MRVAEGSTSGGDFINAGKHKRKDKRQTVCEWEWRRDAQTVEGL